jgi:hypothetical protein
MIMVFSDCNCHSCIRQLGLCEDTRNGLGMGWSHLALQHCNLHSTRHNQVCHPLHLKREGLAELARQQGLVSFMFVKVELCRIS